MIDRTKGELKSKHYYLLLGVIILFALLQSLFLLTKINYIFSEETSFLSACGKLSNYFGILNRKYPYGHLVNIQEYKDLFKIDEKFCFAKIARDTAFFDAHPPFYFWLLHLWILMTGGVAYIWTGVLLNLFLGMFIIVLLFKLAFRLFHSFEDAIFCSLLFVLSPVIYRSNDARHFFLLTIIVLLSSYFFLGFINKDKKITLFRILLFSLLICIGILCHYTFVFVCVAWLIFLCINYWKENKTLILFFIISCLIGFLLFCNIYPGFINNFIIYSTIDQGTYIHSFFVVSSPPLDIKISDVVKERFGTILSAYQKQLIEFLLNSGQIFYYFFISVFVLLFLCIWFSIKKNKLFGFAFASLFYPLSFFTLFFLYRPSVTWTVSERYYLFILPFFYLCIIFFLKSRFISFKRIILVCLCQILIFSTLDDLVARNIEQKEVITKKTLFTNYIDDSIKYNGRDCYVVLDNSILKDLGIWSIFKIIHNLPEGTKIVIADAIFLLSNYSTYFGDRSQLFPLFYITYFDYIKEENRPSSILMRKFIEDKNIGSIPLFLFNNLSGRKEILFSLNRKSKQ